MHVIESSVKNNRNERKMFSLHKRFVYTCIYLIKALILNSAENYKIFVTRIFWSVLGEMHVIQSSVKNNRNERKMFSMHKRFVYTCIYLTIALILNSAENYKIFTTRTFWSVLS